MGRGALLALVPALAVAGCGGSEAPSATATVTATVTATATVTEPASPAPVSDPADTTSSDEAAPARLRLTVFEDGCGVIRSDSPPGAHQSLTWVFKDADGFQVLGRNAEGETRYRYFNTGTYTVVLEAFGPGHYVPVSNTVTVRC